MQGKYAEAEMLCDRSQAIREMLDPEHLDVADSLNRKAAVLEKQVTAEETSTQPRTHYQCHSLVKC